jgi:hypothetical protein
MGVMVLMDGKRTGGAAQRFRRSTITLIVTNLRCALFAIVTLTTGAVTASTVTPEPKTNCLQMTKLKLAKRDLIVTLHDAERIRIAAREYLLRQSSKPKELLSLLEPASIDCTGVVRMGSWILEPSLDDESQLALSFRESINEMMMVRQIIRIRSVKGQWQAFDLQRQEVFRR